MHSALRAWPTRPLGELFDIARQGITPGAFPDEQFVYYSIPTWDEKRAPALEYGAAIGSAKISVTQPTILVSKLNPRISRVIYVQNGTGLRCCASTEFIPYIPKDPANSLDFFRWLFGSSFFRRSLERVATGSTNSHTRARPSDTLTWSVPCPIPERQKQIAIVLDTAEHLNTEINALIKKLGEIRAGMLHDLLSVGLGEHGQVRDSIVNPDDFQDSRFGKTPRAWTLETLRDRLQRNAGFIQTGPFGSQLHANEYRTEGVPVIMPQDISEGRFDETHIARIHPERAKQLGRASGQNG